MPPDWWWQTQVLLVAAGDELGVFQITICRRIPKCFILQVLLAATRFSWGTLRQFKWHKRDLAVPAQPFSLPRWQVAPAACNPKMEFAFSLIFAVFHLDNTGEFCVNWLSAPRATLLFVLCKPLQRLLFPTDVDCIVLHQKEMISASAQARFEHALTAIQWLLLIPGQEN